MPWPPQTSSHSPWEIPQRWCSPSPGSFAAVSDGVPHFRLSRLWPESRFSWTASTTVAKRKRGKFIARSYFEHHALSIFHTVRILHFRNVPPRVLSVVPWRSGHTCCLGTCLLRTDECRRREVVAEHHTAPLTGDDHQPAVRAPKELTSSSSCGCCFCLQPQGDHWLYLEI